MSTQRFVADVAARFTVKFFGLVGGDSYVALRAGLHMAANPMSLSMSFARSKGSLFACALCAWRLSNKLLLACLLFASIAYEVQLLARPMLRDV